MLSQHYLAVPRALLRDVGDNPLAVGLYALVSRLWFVVQEPVPLSRGDIGRYDPSLRVGAIKRALDRLIDTGWLLETPGRKHAYAPSWGRTRAGQAQPWQFGAPRLGCPPHLWATTTRIDRNLLDVYMGRLQPHQRTPTIDRYTTAPLLTLADVGTYALLAAGLVEQPSTGLLTWQLAEATNVLPVPPVETAIALASQRATPDTICLTAKAWKLLNVFAKQTSVCLSTHILFFIEKEQIGQVIPPQIDPLIPIQIGCATTTDHINSCAGGDKIAFPMPEQSMPGNQKETRDVRESTTHGGGSHNQQSFALEQPPTEGAQLLIAFGVNDPTCITDLSKCATDYVQKAIAYAQAEDLGPGWVVDALRRQQQGWPLPQLRRQRSVDWSQVAATYGDLVVQDLAPPSSAPPDGVDELRSTLLLQCDRAQHQMIRSVQLERQGDQLHAFCSVAQRAAIMNTLSTPLCRVARDVGLTVQFHFRE